MKLPQTKWKTKDGRVISIKDMADSHLKNTIKLLKRVYDKQHQDTIASGYNVLSMLNGEMATYYCEQDISRLEEDGPEYPEVYWDMIGEAEFRRKNRQKQRKENK